MQLLHQSPCDSLTYLCSAELLLQLPNLLIQVPAWSHLPLHLMLGSLIFQSSHLQAAPKLLVSTPQGWLFRLSSALQLLVCLSECSR